MDMKTTKKNHEKVNLTSADLFEEQLAQLHKIIPEAFSENKIDWDKLRTALGSVIDERIEKFSFTWAGKGNAIKNVLIPSKATLRPAKDESVMFNESENLFIEGDNLEALKLLQKAYFEQVKMIYIDPPYNTGGDFVYRDDFSAPLSNYLKQTGQKDGNGASLTTNRETSGRYHSDWLSMMYPRLKLAWNLLRDDGVIFVSIDDNELYHLRMILNEIFGEENFVGTLIWRKKEGGGQTDTYFATEHEYIVVYAKSNLFKWVDEVIPANEANFNKEDEQGKFVAVKLAKWGNASRREDRPRMYFPIKSPDDKNLYPKAPDGSDGRWRVGKTRMESIIKNNLVFWDKKNGEWIPYEKVYYEEGGTKKVKERSILYEIATTADGANELTEIFGVKDIFENPKPTRLIEFFVEHATEKDSIILDFFAGSGTTAQAILQLNNEEDKNRRFVLVQLPEPVPEKSAARRLGLNTISEITKERIRRVIKGYGENPEPINSGFKVFKLSESNYPENAFEFDPAKSGEENKEAFESYLLKAKQAKLFDDTKAIDVVYENVVKEGLSLNSKIEETKLDKNDVYVASDGERQLLVCLDRKIDDRTVSELRGKDYKGKVFICLDCALDDSAKANLGLNVELKTI